MTKKNNPIQPVQTLTLDGVEHELHFRHRDLSEAHYQLKEQGYEIDIFGPNANKFWATILSLTDDDPPKPHLDQFKISVALFVGLIHEDPTLKFNDVRDLFTLSNAPAITEAVFVAWYKAFGGASPETTETPEAEDGPPLPAASGGEADGPPPATTSDSEPTQSPEMDQTSSGISPQPSTPPSTSDT